MAGPKRVDFDKFIGWLMWDKGPWFKDQVTTPETPLASHIGVYNKGNVLFWIDDDGVEHSLAGADAGSIAILSQVFRHDSRLVVRETELVLIDITRGDATTSRHGLLPKLSGDATEFLDGTGVFSTPAGGGDFLVAQVFS